MKRSRRFYKGLCSQRLNPKKYLFFWGGLFFMLLTIFLVGFSYLGINKITPFRVSLRENYPSEVERRESVGIWCEAEISNATSTDSEEMSRQERIGGCFYIDKEGVLLEETLFSSGSLILVVKDYSGKGLSIGDQPVTSQFLEFVLEIKEELPQKANLEIEEYRTSSLDTLEIRASEGWLIFFDATRDPSSQIDVLKRVLNQEIKKDRQNLEYIDLRMEGRVYYK